MATLADAPNNLALPLEKAAPVLAMHVQRVHRRIRRTLLQTGLGAATVSILLWLILALPLDRYLDLPWWVRATNLVAVAGFLTGIAWWHLIRPGRKGTSDDEVALMIEQAVPTFKSRFIASVQLARQPEEHHRPLVRALVKETVEQTREADFTYIIDQRRRNRWLNAAGVALALACTLAYAAGKSTVPLLKRAFLVEAARPTDTLIEAFTGSRGVAVGDDLVIEAVVGGKLPTEATLHLQRGPERSTFRLTSAPDQPRTFARKIASVQQGFQYWIQAGDARTPLSTVSVHRRPTITSLTFEHQPPAYTGLASEVQSGSLNLLAGSDLAIRLESNVPLGRAELIILGADDAAQKRELLMTAGSHPDTCQDWRVHLPLVDQATRGLVFRITDRAGFQSAGTAVYPVSVRPDAPPKVQVESPARREELITRKAKLAVAFSAEDEFGVAQVKLHYAVNWAPGSSHRTVELYTAQESTRSIRREFPWDFSKFSPPLNVGDVVDFWLEARDNNDRTGPGVTVMAEHRRLRVVSDAEKAAELTAHASETLQRLEDLRRQQDDVARRVGELLHHPSTTP